MQNTAEFYQYETIKIDFCLSYCGETPIPLAENEVIEAQISTVDLQPIASFDVDIIDRSKGMFSIIYNGVLEPADYICNIFFIHPQHGQIQRIASPTFDLVILPSPTIPSGLGG